MCIQLKQIFYYSFQAKSNYFQVDVEQVNQEKH